MTAEDELRNEVDQLISGTGPRRPVPTPMGMMGPETPEQRIAALETDIRALYKGLLAAGRQIQALRDKIGGGQ